MPARTLIDPTFLARLEALRLAVRWVRWGSRVGGHFPISRRGSSVEFADYLAYTPGDDFRAIDWKLYARLDRLFVKTFKEDIELAAEVIVDATASMALPSPEKFDRARQLGLCLAYIGLAGHHQVRMSWIAPGKPRASPWFTQRADLTQLGQLAEPMVPAGTVEVAQWIGQATMALRIRGGQALLISDGMYRAADWFRALHGLLRRHVEVKIIQVISAEELNPARLVRSGVLVDSETGLTHELAYQPAQLARAVLEHNEQLARFCKRHGILFVQHRLDESLEQFILKTLPARGYLE